MLLLVACGGGSTSGNSSIYTLKATVTGLSGGGLRVNVFANGFSSSVPIPASENDHAVLLATVANGTTYSLSVPSGSQPTSPSETCSIVPATGQVSANVNVAITRVTSSYPISVSVSGLAPTGTYTGLGLQNSLQPGSEPVFVNTDGDFPLNGLVTSGQNYQISVTQQPSPTAPTDPPVYCTVTNVGGIGTRGARCSARLISRSCLVSGR